MSTAAFIFAAVLAIAALPLIVRIAAALRAGLRGRARIEAGRLALAAAAVAMLVTIAGRTR